MSWQYAKKSGLMYANSRRWAAGDKKCGISGERGWKTPAHCTPGHTLDAAVCFVVIVIWLCVGGKRKNEKSSSFGGKRRWVHILGNCFSNAASWIYYDAGDDCQSSSKPSLPDSVVLWWFEEKGVTWYSKLTATLARWSGDWETSVFDLSRLLPCLEKIGLIKRHLIWIQQAITGFLEISLQFCSNTASDSLHKYHDHLPKVVF